MVESINTKSRPFKQNKLFGLTNMGNANNCSINVCVQTIWHLSGFVRALRSLILEADRLQERDGSLFWLAKLFSEIKESEEDSQHTVTELKRATLAEIFGKDQFDDSD